MRQIEVFHAIYTTGSVTGAGKLLHVSQPAISKVLQRTEEELGYLLFKRAKGKLFPTDEAHKLFVEVKSVFQQILSLQNKARNLKAGKASHIRLSVMPALGLNVLPHTIVRFLKDYPDVTFDIHTQHFENMLSSLYEYEIDLGFAFSPAKQVGLVHHPVGSGEFVCVYKPGEFKNNGSRIHFKELENKRIISIKDSGPLSDILHSNYYMTRMLSTSQITVQTYYVAKNLVAYGMGVAIIDELTAKTKGTGTTHYKGFSSPIMFEVAGLNPDSRPLSNICKEFLACFKQVYAEFLEKG